MRSRVSIIPTILAVTEEGYREKAEKISSCPELAKGWVQIDLMDNKFVQNKSIGLDTVAHYSVPFKLEAHLMVDYPDDWIDDLVKLQFKRIIFPVEDSEGISERIDQIKKLGLEVGLSLNPETSLAKAEPFIDRIDLLLLMSVHPGFGGQQLLLETVTKVREAAKLKEGTDFIIEVDGGINESNARVLVEAGADNLVIGEHLINGNITENFTALEQSINS